MGSSPHLARAHVLVWWASSVGDDVRLNNGGGEGVVSEKDVLVQYGCPPGGAEKDVTFLVEANVDNVLHSNDTARFTVE